MEGLREIAAPKNTSTDSETRRLLLEDAQGTSSSASNQTEKSSTPAGAREVYDAQGKELGTGEPGEKARFEGEKPTGNTDIDNAYDYSGNVRDFYKEVFGRNSIDDKGMNVISRINYGQNFEGSFWDDGKMTYGKPSDSSLYTTFVLEDITGHEITHGISDYDSQLKTYGQAGALNESIGDVFGELVKQWSHHEKSGEADWVFGKGIWKSSVNGRGLRDLLHPGTAFDDPKAGKDPQPADLAHYVRTMDDNGGVHVNSGIPNRAFAEFATSLGGYAWEEAGHIWYQALKNAGSNPSFAQFAEATVEAAQKLGYKNDLPKLEQSWQDVGVTPSATQTDDLTPGLFFPGSVN